MAKHGHDINQVKTPIELAARMFEQQQERCIRGLPPYTGRRVGVIWRSVEWICSHTYASVSPFLTPKITRVSPLRVISSWGSRQIIV